MKISGVYIAKNEEKNLARSLESIKDTVDELILVDTGSTDNTVDVFKAYGGKVFYQQWQDDFSVPRNLALSKATGDWLILLDADESFSKNTRQNIRAVIEQAVPHTQGLLIRMINYDKDTGKAQDEFYALRIVRNIPGLNYQGRIHEMLHVGQEHLADMQRVSGDLLTIDHTGYRAGLSQEKCRRNLALMQAAIAAGEPEERYYTYLYEAYAGLGDMEQALHYGWLDVERGRQSITYATRSYRGLMSYYAKDNSPEGKNKRLQLVQKGVHDFPELPDFHAEYSECLYQLGRFQEANIEMNKAISLFKDYDGLEPCLLSLEMIPLMEKRQQEMEKMAAKHPNIKISACVIVKNEEGNIRDWLENVSVFADEIIINDTGSEDNTKKIIAEFSDANPDIPMVLVESMWQDDFSFAKNQCIAEVTGDWIVFTDADEIFVNPESVKGYIYSINSEEELQIVFVPMANVDKDDNNGVINSFNSLRIFRNLAGIHYEGRIHESIVLNNKDIACLNSRVAPQSLLIHHTGYSRNISYAKAKRNLQLLLLDIEEGQDIRKLYYYLAQCYFTLKDYQKALDNALLAIQSDYQPMGLQGDIYWLALNSMEELDYSTEDKMVLADNGITLFPQIPDFYIRKGILLFEDKKFHEAVKWFEKAENIINEYNNSGNNDVSSNYLSVLHEFYATWGRCLYKTGYSQKAEEKFIKALHINPWYDKALCYWADIYQGRLHEEFLSSLSAIYDKLENSGDLLSSIFGTNGFPELAAHFQGEDYYALISEKEYGKIYNKSMKEIAEIIPSLSVCLLEDYNDSYADILPEKMRTLVRYFHNLPDKGEIEACFEAYKTILLEVVAFATEDVAKKYLDMLGVFSETADEAEEKIVEVADKLMDIQKYEIALSLYEQLPEKSTSRTEEYWQNVGICHYGLGQYQKAMECFDLAVNNKKTDTYKLWCQEAMKNVI